MTSDQRHPVPTETTASRQPALPPDPGWLAGVLEQAATGVLITDARGLVLYANRCHCEQRGCRLEALLGRPADLDADRHQTTVIPVPDDMGQVRCHLVLTRATPVRENGEGTAAPGAGSCDPLTGLADRAAFRAGLDRAVRQAAANGGDANGVVVAYLNLDRFAAFNQVMGHGPADALLVRIVDRIGRAIRRDDLLARIGGDEFAILFTRVRDQSTCSGTIDRILERIRQPVVVNGCELAVSASIGIARHPDHGSDADTLLSNAHAAMRLAKDEGGDQYCLYRPPQRPVTIDQLDLAGQLRFAVERNELLLHYQPQVSLVSGEIVGLEALVRWNRPGIGLVPPGVFIPIAEETGRIVAIGEWVLAEVIAQLLAWQRAGVPLVKVAVNLAANHFHNPALPGLIDRLLGASGIEPHLLELELTESTVMRNVARVTEIVGQLKARGLSLSLDDFGTGHSSLAHLSRLPIDLVKIDRSFVSDLTTNPTNASIVAATVAMTHKLGMRVIAEGVETEAQLALLRRLHCDQMQGFLFSRPLPAAEAAALLREGRRQPFAEAAPGRNLLLVDDDPHVLQGLRRVFYRSGYRVHTAAGGAEALEILAATPVQVIISDQLMPGMTGVQLLGRVRRMYPATVRIILSGYAELATVTEAINHGAVWKYLMKPWSGELLRQLVAEAFRHAEEGD